jgi:hypothetical protein
LLLVLGAGVLVTTTLSGLTTDAGALRMSGSSWNFGGDPRGLTVRR